MLKAAVSLSSASIIAVSIIVCYIIYYFISWISSPLKKIPGPTSLPILGNLLDFVNEPNEHDLYIKWRRQYGSIFKFSMPLVGPIVFTSDPELVKQLLVTDAVLYDRSDFLVKLLPETKDGVFLAHQEENVRQRKLINPMFSYASVKRYKHLFIKKASSLRQVWLKRIEENGGPIKEDIYWYMRSVTIDVISKVVLDRDLGAVEGKTSEERDNMEFLSAGDWNLVWKSLEAIFPFLTWIPTKYRARVTRARNCIRRIIKEVADERMAKTAAGETVDKDILQVILDMYKHENPKQRDDNVYHQVATMLIAGFDTTSTALTWTLYLLAQHKDVQDKVRREISDILGDETEVSWEHIGDLNYLDCCIKESLRIRSPGDFLYRLPKKDVKLGPYHIPKKTQISVGIGTQHMASDYWKDADSFRPDRYNEIGQSDSNFPYWYFPFSRGPRTCPGRKFAETELRIVLATLLKEFEFSIPEGHPVVDGQVELVYKPKPSPRLLISRAGRSDL